MKIEEIVTQDARDAVRRELLSEALKRLASVQLAVQLALLNEMERRSRDPIVYTPREDSGD